MKKFLVFVLILSAAGYYFYTRNVPAEDTVRRGARGDGPVAVLVAPSRLLDVPVTLEAVGTIQSLNSVTVRAQIDGKLMKIAFSDGQDVKAGDILALIDPTTAQAAYDQAVAKKAQDQALLSNAKIDLVRYQKLAQTEYGSRQQSDTQQSSVAQLEAQIRADQASIDSYKAQLEFTTVRAPIDGRTGIRNMDQGNIIRSSDANGLVVITQLKPMGLVFGLAQQYLRKVIAANAKQVLSIQVLDADNVGVLDTGTLSVIDNLVDQTTGTVKIKAVFPNVNLQLWPGQFVNVRVLVDTLQQVVTVPTSSVQRGPAGPYVYSIDSENKVSLKLITVGQQDELVSVVNSGLDAGTKVVITGFTRLTDGAKVMPTDAAQPTDVQVAPSRKSREPASEGKRQNRREDNKAKPDTRPSEAVR